jgi:hypothetical protein
MAGIAHRAMTSTGNPGKIATVYLAGADFGEMEEIKTFPVY